MARTLGLRGIDISQWQAETPPLSYFSFVVLRASISQTKDTRYDQHYAAAREAGLVVMAYHFAYSADQSSIPAQVKVFLSVAKDADFLWLDQEESGFDDEQAQEFIDLVHAAGRPIGLYHSASGFGGVRADAQWVADYRDASVAAGYPRRISDGAELPGWDLWQWSSKGAVSGYSGNLDMNWMNPASPLAALLRTGYVAQPVVDAAAAAATTRITQLENQVSDLQAEISTLKGQISGLQMKLDAAPRLEQIRIAEKSAQAERDRIMAM